MQYFKDLFRGRINRRNYALGTVIYEVVIVLLYMYGGYFPDYVLYIFIGLLLMYLISMNVRRFHDVGRSGWGTLWNIIPIMGLIISIYLIFKEGEDHENKYGAVPKPVIDLGNVFIPHISSDAPVNQPQPNQTSSQT